jgi:hypothetical protein
MIASFLNSTATGALLPEGDSKNKNPTVDDVGNAEHEVRDFECLTLEAGSILGVR